MCFDLDSSPPVPPISGAAVSHEDLVLEAADGNRFAAFAATPDAPSNEGVVILPDVRGLYRFYEELALRFAERGIAATAFDYFGRTAGIAKRDDDFAYMDHVSRTDPATIQLDVAAARRLAPGPRRQLDLHGRVLLRRPQLVAFHRRRPRSRRGRRLLRQPAARGDWPGPINRAAELKGPILALQAGADQNITSEQNAAFDEALTAAGVEHEVVTYEGAPHSFFDRKQEQFRRPPTTPGSGRSLSSSATRSFSHMEELLLAWFAEHGRELPWRGTRDPYAILVSEVMLQQTQVSRVVPRYWSGWTAGRRSNRWPRRRPRTRSAPGRGSATTGAASPCTERPA